MKVVPLVNDAPHAMNSTCPPVPSSVVGDGGASWRLKALKFAQEQAVREGREVLEEHLGSLGQLAASVVSHRAAKAIKSGKEDSVGIQGLSANQLAAKALLLRLKGKHGEAEKLLKEVESMTDIQVSQAINKKAEGVSNRGVPSGLKKGEDHVGLNLAEKIIQKRQYDVSGLADDDYDVDEAPVRKCKKRRDAVGEDRRILTRQDRCQFCLGNPTWQRHFVISVGNFTYMMLPQLRPVVKGHCCILPFQHEPSTRSLDDDVWGEIRNFKKCLIRMFAEQDKDVVFLETVIGLSRQRRHCLVDCIPLPRELAKQAPLYFRKAIDDAEDEWSQHNAKRLIETTSEKGLKRSIPRDFPYFHVEFGLDKGFVHVIEDEGKFSSLGLNVIRGMLSLPVEDMYRTPIYILNPETRQARPIGM